ncbi:ECF transporter S component [Schaalia canis]|uniref:ABC transporter permease n=1 Tax=Schaalia canis TaxID=100469 RepID=A0A3P1SDE3_9ACTO|nr:ECF transporter S component [Schaalia canis]RRC95066.1 ABC transporter permease [Schaalia canis]
MESTSTSTADDIAVRGSARSGLRDSVLGTRNLMTVAALAVVGSLITIPLSYITPLIATSPRGIIIMCAIMGVWMIPYLLPGVIVNKPGAFVIAGLILGVISTFTTSFGAGAIVGNLIGALFVGVPVALFLYRFWTWWVYMISAAVFGGLNGWMYWSAYGIEGTTAEMTISLLISLTSCFAGVGVCLLLKRALARAGVGINN